MIFFMALGYGICVLLLLGVGIAQRATGRRDASAGTFAWSVVVLVLGFAFAWCWLPTWQSEVMSAEVTEFVGGLPEVWYERDVA